MNDEENNLEKSLIRSISSPKLSDLADLTELGLDSFLSDGVAKDLPFVGSLIKLYEGVIGIRERLFLKKVLKFLFELKDIPGQEREAWCQKLTSDKTEQVKVGESLILLLDRLDSMEKAEIEGRLFRAYLENKIDYSTFERLSSMVDRISLPDLREFSTSRWNNNRLLIVHLANVGLMSISGIVQTGASGAREVKIVPDRSSSLPVGPGKLVGLEQAMGNLVKNLNFTYEINKYGRALLEFGLKT